MINIITGIIDSGKTSYLKRHYEEHRAGDGVISIKHIEKERFEGYDLLHLKSGASVPFIRLIGLTPPGWKEMYLEGGYHFSATGFELAGRVFDQLLEDPVYLDEIGPLEVLRNKGFHTILTELIAKERDLFLGVRYSLLDEMIKKYINHKEIRVITI